MKEKLLLSEFESVTQNTLDANKECYSERRLRDQSEKKSINTILNFYFFKRVSHSLRVSIVFSVYNQNFTVQ